MKKVDRTSSWVDLDGKESMLWICRDGGVSLTYVRHGIKVVINLTTKQARFIATELLEMTDAVHAIA